MPASQYLHAHINIHPFITNPDVRVNIAMNNIAFLIPCDPTTGMVNALESQHLTDPKKLIIWILHSNFSLQYGHLKTHKGMTHLNTESFNKRLNEKVYDLAFFKACCLALQESYIRTDMVIDPITRLA